MTVRVTNQSVESRASSCVRTISLCTSVRIPLTNTLDIYTFHFAFIWVIAIFIINKPFSIIPFALLFFAWTRLLHTTIHNFGFCKLGWDTCEIAFPCFTLSKIISSFNHGCHSIIQNTLSGLIHLQCEPREKNQCLICVLLAFSRCLHVHILVISSTPTRGYKYLFLSIYLSQSSVTSLVASLALSSYVP